MASRGFFQDRALESRFITEEMGHARLRDNIPINLPRSHRDEARSIRNKLLLFRFRMLQLREPEALVDRSLEPRLNQVLTPLMSVMQDSKAQDDLKILARQYQRDLEADRGMDMEAQVLEIIRTMRDNQPDQGLSIKAISAAFIERYGDEYARKVTPHWIGYVIRRKLGLKTEKRHGTYVIAASEGSKLERLFERYGVTPLPEDLGDFGDFSETGEKAERVVNEG